MSEDVPVAVTRGDGLDRISEFCQVGLMRTGVDAMTVTFANAFADLELLLATDPLAEQVAQLEFTLGQGPGIDALASGMPVIADDLRTDVSAHRWPLFASEAVEVGARAAMAYPMMFSRHALGTVGFYSRRPARLSSQRAPAGHRHHRADRLGAGRPGFGRERRLGTPDVGAPGSGDGDAADGYLHPGCARPAEVHCVHRGPAGDRPRGRRHLGTSQFRDRDGVK